MSEDFHCSRFDDSIDSILICFDVSVWIIWCNFKQRSCILECEKVFVNFNYLKVSRVFSSLWCFNVNLMSCLVHTNMAHHLTFWWWWVHYETKRHSQQWRQLPNIYFLNNSNASSGSKLINFLSLKVTSARLLEPVQLLPHSNHRNSSKIFSKNLISPTKASAQLKA